MEGGSIRQARRPPGGCAGRHAPPTRPVITALSGGWLTPRKTVQNFLRPLPLALSCVTDAQIATGGDYSTTTEHAWVVAGGEPFPLPRARGASLRARLGQNYRIVRAEGQRGPWKVKITAYH